MGNRASRLLAFQLRKAQTHRIILKVKHPISKQLVVKPTKIAEAFAEYYKDLHNDSELISTENKTQVFKLNLPLSAEEASEMILPITV